MQRSFGKSLRTRSLALKPQGATQAQDALLAMVEGAATKVEAPKPAANKVAKKGCSRLGFTGVRAWS